MCYLWISVNSLSIDVWSLIRLIWNLFPFQDGKKERKNLENYSLSLHTKLVPFVDASYVFKYGSTEFILISYMK